MSNKVTLRDIADDLAISVPTVHRALSGTGRISAETKKLILHRASELGYHSTYVGQDSAWRFAFICPDNEFYQEIIHGARIATEEHKTSRTEYLVSQDYSPEHQVRHLREILEGKNYDGVAICPVHPMLITPLINSLVDRGIPVVTFNNDASQSRRQCYVGENAHISGTFAAQLYSSILPENAKVALLQSLVSAEELRLRIKGFKEYVRMNPKIQILGTYDFYDNIDSANEIARQLLLTTFVDAIFVNSMFGTIGTARALHGLSTSERPFMIGYDLNAEIHTFINQEILYGTLFQSPVHQGYLAINALCKLLSMHDHLSETIHLPTHLILKSNLNQNQDYDLL